MDNLMEKLTAVFQAAMPGADVRGIRRESSLQKDLELDSLNMMLLAVIIEDEFQIRFRDDFQAETVGELCDYIEAAQKIISPRVGLILEGGARRSIFTAGVLDCFLEENLSFDYAVGASAGAQSAMDFLAGHKGRSRKTITADPGKYPMSPSVRARFAGYLRKTVYEYPYKQFPFDFHKLFASDTVLEIVVTNADTGRAEYFRETQDEKRLLDIQMASCSVPILSHMGVVDGHKYIDGSIADAIPIERAWECGCEKAVVILTKAPDEMATDYSRMKPLISPLYEKNHPALYETLVNRIDRYREQRELVKQLEKEGRVFVLQPEAELVKPFERDLEKLNAGYWYAYRAAKARMDDLRAFLEK